MVSKFTGEHQKIKSIHSRPRERLTVVKVLSMERLLYFITRLWFKWIIYKTR